MSKICNNCGKTVNDNDNFCPYCRGTSFKNKFEVVEANDSPVHRLLYWNYDGYYAISKSKVSGIVIFLIFALYAITESVWGMLLFAFAFGALTYVLGYCVHQMIPKPSRVKLEHNDYGLLTDLKHFLFFWQNNQGQYVLSKTKIISHLVFLLIVSMAISSPTTVLAAAIFVALIFEAPVFLLGYGIHKLTNPNPEAPDNYIEPTKNPVKAKIPKRVKPKAIKKGILPEYMGYVSQLDAENSRFKTKEKTVRNLIEKRFEPPQLTYSRFINGVDKSAEMFKKQSDSAYTLINMADEYSPRIAGEIESKIDILDSINDKLENLANELVLTDGESKKEDVENVISDMDNLIKSVKDYDQQ